MCLNSKDIYDIENMYKCLQDFARKKCYGKQDCEEFSNWAIEKIIARKKYSETNASFRSRMFKSLFIDYLRESKADKRLQPDDFERAKRIKGDISVVHTGLREWNRNDKHKIELVDTKNGSNTGNNRTIDKIIRGREYSLKTKAILYLVFDAGFTMKEVGQIFNISEARISQIISEARDKEYRQIKMPEIPDINFESLETINLEIIDL